MLEIVNCREPRETHTRDTLSRYPILRMRACVCVCEVSNYRQLRKVLFFRSPANRIPENENTKNEDSFNVYRGRNYEVS